MIYEGSPVHHLHGLATIAKRKLEANNRCLYLNSPALVEEMRSHLAAAGVDVAQEIEKGALILSSERAHLIEDRFDVDKMLGTLAEAVNQAVQDGYEGLWATGDMAWEFGDEKNFSKLLEYEHALERFFETEPALSGICQFHAGTLPTDVIQWGLCAHRTVYINETLSKINPYYADGGLLTHRQPNISRTELRAMLACCS